jgi:hypothetical protein
MHVSLPRLSFPTASLTVSLTSGRHLLTAFFHAATTCVLAGALVSSSQARTASAVPTKAAATGHAACPQLIVLGSIALPIQAWMR